MWTHNTEFSGPNKDVPVIVQSLDNQGNPENWHETSDDEYEAYHAYWTEPVGPHGEERGEL